jgi:hypothetical protein
MVPAWHSNCINHSPFEAAWLIGMLNIPHHHDDEVTRNKKKLIDVAKLDFPVANSREDLFSLRKP